MKIQTLSDNTYLVQSDSGSLNKVQVTGAQKNIIMCTCKGFLFRRDCGHVEEIKKILAKKGRKVKNQPAPKDPYAFINPYKEQIKKQLGMK